MVHRRTGPSPRDAGHAPWASGSHALSSGHTGACSRHAASRSVNAVLTLLRRSFTAEEARQVAAWAYPQPFHLYDSAPDNPDLFIARDADGSGYYPAVDDDGRLVAFAVGTAWSARS